MSLPPITNPGFVKWALKTGLTADLSLLLKVKEVTVMHFIESFSSVNIKWQKVQGHVCIF